MKVESDIPIPETPHGETSRGKIGRPPKYPFHQMGVGESVFIDGQGMKGSAYRCARHYAQSHDKKFCAKELDGGIRIWRVE